MSSSKRETALVAVLGPTASGKTALGLELAKRLQGEIVSCDSLQVYSGMDIGTAKPTAAERRAIPHHLLDVLRPDQEFNAARWADMARTAIAGIRARGHLPIVVGGTGLYFRALAQGLFEAPPPDPEIRERHKEEAGRLGAPALHARLQQIDPEAAAGIQPGDLVRISRALEVWEQTGVPITQLRRQAQHEPVQAFTVVLDPPLEELRERIGRRVERMMIGGFLDEVKALRAAGYGPACKPMQSLGYLQLNQHLDGAIALEHAVSATRSATVAYARRQRTWFKKEPASKRLEAAPDLPVLTDEIARAAGGGWLPEEAS